MLFFQPWQEGWQLTTFLCPGAKHFTHPHLSQAPFRAKESSFSTSEAIISKVSFEFFNCKPLKSNKVPLKEKVFIQILKGIEFSWMSFLSSPPTGEGLRDYPKSQEGSSADSRERGYIASQCFACYQINGSRMEQLARETAF